MNRGRRAIAAVAAFIASIMSQPALAQCAMCGSAAGAGDVGRGLSISVLFLLGVLATAVAGLVIIIVRASPRDTPRAPAGD